MASDDLCHQVRAAAPRLCDGFRRGAGGARARAVRNRLMNRAISERNRNRAAWARAISGGSAQPALFQ